jgi:TolA-binding protein
METENRQIRKNLKRKLVTSIAVKFILVAFSFVQAHCVSIACAAGTVAAATMFGDKAYWVNISKETEKAISGKTPQEAVKLIEVEIAKYPKWREENSDKAFYTDLQINDLYFQLAKSKEDAGLDKNEIIDAYKHAVASPSYGGDAFVWLYKNTPDMERHDVFKQVFKDVAKDIRGYQKIVAQLEKSDDWSTFELFLGTVVDQAKEPVSAAKSIETSLEREGKWVDKFIKYCRGKPRMIEFVYERDCRAAEGLVKQENFKKAAAAYKDMATRYEAFAEQKVDIEFRICQCLFNAGDYNITLSELNSFLERNKTKNRKLSKDAFLLKGQCYIQLGEVGKAANEFITLMVEYPETKESPEASFFVGYCYMLQGKFDMAKEALNVVVKDYPQSSFASKAKLCLTRIENMVK